MLDAGGCYIRNGNSGKVRIWLLSCPDVNLRATKEIWS